MLSYEDSKEELDNYCPQRVKRQINNPQCTMGYNRRINSTTGAQIPQLIIPRLRLT